jgi:hypothetical protein
MSVQDKVGDVGFGVDPKTGLIWKTWADNTPIFKAGYFDMVSTSLSMKGKTYTFGMKLASQLPTQGSPLPGGIRLAEWAVWFDPSPYNVNTNPVSPLFLVGLRYDGSAYSAFVLDYSTMTSTPTSFSVNGADIAVQFTAASIGNLALEWWSPLVREWTGSLGSAGYWFVDAIVVTYDSGEVGIDIPWLPQ